MHLISFIQQQPWCSSNWRTPIYSNTSKYLIRECKHLPEAKVNDDITDLETKSKEFPIKFPIETVRLHELKKYKPEEELKNNIVSTYPLLHARVLSLISEFIIYKRHFGSKIEQDLYKDMKIPQFIDRILTKRALEFIGAKDKYRLITGLIGPRFKRKFRMDFEDIVINVDQNSRQNGYGEEASTTTTECLKKLKTTHPDSEQSSKAMWRKLWADFYQVPSYTYETILDQVKHRKKDPPSYKERFVPLSSTVKSIFDNETYYKRIRVMAECTLYEANNRAGEANKMAYLNVIGCGLGVWMISKHQLDVYVLSFVHTIHDLLQAGALRHVADVNFAYITPTNTIMDYFTKLNSEEREIFLKNDAHPKGGISVTLISREPSSKLTGEHAGKLLVLTYPWDSNAHPGNEFWHGNLKGSGDPAAASCTQVAELHNAYINPAVAGNNARVAGPLGVKRISEYCLELSK